MFVVSPLLARDVIRGYFWFLFFSFFAFALFVEVCTLLDADCAPISDNASVN